MIGHLPDDGFGTHEAFGTLIVGGGCILGILAVVKQLQQFAAGCIVHSLFVQDLLEPFAGQFSLSDMEYLNAAESRLYA